MIHRWRICVQRKRVNPTRVRCRERNSVEDGPVDRPPRKQSDEDDDHDHQRRRVDKGHDADLVHLFVHGLVESGIGAAVHVPRCEVSGARSGGSGSKGRTRAGSRPAPSPTAKQRPRHLLRFLRGARRYTASCSAASADSLRRIPATRTRPPSSAANLRQHLHWRHRTGARRGRGRSKTRRGCRDERTRAADWSKRWTTAGTAQSCLRLRRSRRLHSHLEATRTTVASVDRQLGILAKSGFKSRCESSAGRQRTRLLILADSGLLTDRMREAP